MIAGLLAVGCSKDKYDDTTNSENQNIAPSFIFEEGTYFSPTVSSDGGALVYRFMTNTTWSVTSAEEWIDIDPASGDAADRSFTILVAKNETGRERTGRVKVAYGKNHSLNITIYQDEEYCASNEVAYKTTDGQVITPATTEGFGAAFIENTYADGYGKLRFEGDVKSIPAEAFKDCTTLVSITLPENLEIIGNNAFEGCLDLESIALNSKITTIGDMAFSRCHSLPSIELSQSITSIGAKAFYSCFELASISIPEGITAISDYMFYNCIALNDVKLNNNIESIGNNAFAFCTSLNAITIPNSVKSIGNSAFSNCGALTKVVLGIGVESIGDYAFIYCKSLNSIALPNSVKELGSYAFNSCERLTNIELSNALTSIGDSTFTNCNSLVTITIPALVSSIGDNAMFGCSKLTTVNCLATTPPTLGASALDKYNKSEEEFITETDEESVKVVYEVTAINANIYVPTASVEAYKGAEGWSNYASKIAGKDF